MMAKWLFAPPSVEDLVRLLKAWRFWLSSALAGALIGLVWYTIAPPPYRATATVLVDFNLEEAWPQDTDRQHFYYLERETRKLEEIAWSDSVMQAVVNAVGDVTVKELRDTKLQLSQPAEGGWHFYADDADPQRAELIASSWAVKFVEDARRMIADQTGLNAFIELTPEQVEDLPVSRRVDKGSYLIAGALAAQAASAFGILFFHPIIPSTVRKVKPGTMNGRRKKR